MPRYIDAEALWTTLEQFGKLTLNMMCILDEQPTADVAPVVPNEPLTLEELRKMDGEPVWLEDLEEPRNSEWRLCFWDRGKYLVLHSIHSHGYLLDEYGKTWITYRRKPASGAGEEQ